MKRFAFVAPALSLLSLSFAASPDRAQVKATDYPPPKPAFAGQTGAPAPEKPSPALKVDTIVTRLNNPWSMALLPGGEILVTERTGEMRIVNKDGVFHRPLADVPGVKVIGAGGLHDVAIDPHFSENRLIYFTYFAPPAGEEPGVWPGAAYARFNSLSLDERRAHPIGTERLARARLSDDEKSLENVQVLLDGLERRLLFAPDGKLFVTGADRSSLYDTKGDPATHQVADESILRTYTGRVARINPDGSISKDNPFAGTSGVPAETYSYGHRDPEGLAINPITGDLWLDEHGPMGGDEINIIKPGKNYGWPNVSYGRQYSGEVVGNGAQAKEGTEQPIYFWYPDIGPSGMLFYTGDMFPDWKGNVFIGALYGKFLIRLVIDGNKVVGEEHLLGDLGQRIRLTLQAPDGSLLVLTDAGNILKITPKK
jgi:glucose/arabinose dehydrogenase